MVIDRERVLILSGSSLLRYPTLLNHRAYADRHGYRYRFDLAPRQNVANLYFHKLALIDDHLPDCEWLFWLDDDAAFLQLDVSFEQRVPELRDSSPPWAIFCKSPINRGFWTYLSSGNFLIRNCSEARTMLKACLATDLAEVSAWWDAEKYGLYTSGDQDAIVYYLARNPEVANGCQILEYERFNTRPFHFDRLNDHFLVHFTHLPDQSKRDQMRAFALRFGLTDFLLPEAAVEPYRAYEQHLRATIGEAL